MNKAFKEEHDKLYSFEDYISRIRKLVLRDFDLFPDPRGTEEATVIAQPAPNSALITP
jgi:hypothetical protein